MNPGALYHCIIHRWTVMWGDPWLTGTVTMLLYGIGGLLLLRVARRTDSTDRRLWMLCAFLFFFQVVNTHLDLHAVPGAIGHCVSRAQGWYESRGQVRVLGLIVIATVTLVVVAAATIAWWRSISANALLVLGVAITVAFTLVRGTALDDLEKVYHLTAGPFTWGDLIEYLRHRDRLARGDAAPAAAARNTRCAGARCAASPAGRRTGRRPHARGLGWTRPMPLSGAIADHFRTQATACARLGSPFTAHLCERLVALLDGGTGVGRRVQGWPGDPRADALALRLCGGLHALARSGDAPELAAVYPPAPVAAPGFDARARDGDRHA